MNLEVIDQIYEIIPATYDEAVKLYPDIQCEPHEWEGRTVLENIVWIINHLSTRKERSIMPNKDGTGPPAGSNGPRDGSGGGRSGAPGQGLGQSAGGQKGDCPKPDPAPEK